MFNPLTPHMIENAARFFLSNQPLENISPLGNGLINDTYLVRTNTQSLVIQRINTEVFKQPKDILRNAQLINQHLNAQQAAGNYHMQTIAPELEHQQQLYIDQQDNHWRALQFIDHSFSLEQINSPTEAYQAAAAFAEFARAFNNFNAQELNTIIADFHLLSSRMAQLQQAIANNHDNRLRHCQPQVTFCMAQSAFIQKIAEISENLPVRVTHNDTKINNLLFSDQTKLPIAVIDLDTCMPGFLMHDFGDLVRTCCSTLTEDDVKIENMCFRNDIFSALLNGYTETFTGLLSPQEQKSLLLGAKLMPFMVGVRFLTDYLNGDSYFHIQHPKHNLHRAINQLHLYHLVCNELAQL